MPKSISILKRSLITATALVLVGGLIPVGVYADDPSTPTCTPPSGGAGVHKPVGADASTYTYNCTTGLWQNDHFTYDPSTGLVTPTDPVVYTYNPVTGLYDTTVWVYDAPINDYTATTTPVAQPPAGANVVGGPAPVVPASGPNNGSNDGTDGSTGSTDGTGGISNTGPDSNNSLDSSANNNTLLNNQNGLSITNLGGQQAASGDAIVSGNTTGGSATSGNAVNQTMLTNSLQSTSNALGSNAVTFVANINGDVNGDLLFDPATLGAVQNTGPSSVNTTAADANNNLTVNNSTGAAIVNNIDQGAQTGDATVSDNTTGGNATSGNAENIAEISNLIDSMITAGQSFIGTININGNLNGNILLPANLVQQLLADNVPTVSVTGPNSDNSADSSLNNNATINNTNNEGINNNVSSNAATGNATVSGNTTGGSATSGEASNTTTGSNSVINAFNLTGSNVIGSNDILVFVNVTGQWVGLIVGAPAGTTAAEFGGGITSTGPNSDNSTDASANNNATINNNNNQQITNNIDQNAQSGNATVRGNTTGGNATSGNADNIVGLTNIEGSTFNLTGWFGILFINVFGSWHGNFGVEPSPADSVGGAVTTTTTSSGTKGGVVPAIAKVFGFVSQNGNTTNFATGSGNDGTTNGTVLAAQHSNNTGTPTPQLASAHRNPLLPIAAILLFVTYLVAERAFAKRRRENKLEAQTAAHAANIHAQAI
jgi:hypothetical protein